MNNEKPIIRRVYPNRVSKQLLVSVPKNRGIEEGDYVVIKKVEI